MPIHAAVGPADADADAAMISGLMATILKGSVADHAGAAGRLLWMWPMGLHSFTAWASFTLISSTTSSHNAISMQCTAEYADACRVRPSSPLHAAPSTVCSLQGWGQPQSECRSANILLSKEGRAKIGDAGQASSFLSKAWQHGLVDKPRGAVWGPAFWEMYLSCICSL